MESIHKAQWLASCFSEPQETNPKSWFLGDYGGVMENIRAPQIAILGKVFPSTIPKGVVACVLVFLLHRQETGALRLSSELGTKLKTGVS